MEKKLPKQVKIGGATYQVVITPNMADSGSCTPQEQIIRIEEKMCQEQKESTLIHEILEAINTIYNLNLPHQTIQTLEAAIYQIIKDNL